LHAMASSSSSGSGRKAPAAGVSQIFVEEQGPLTFYVPPCSMASKLKELIKAGGGVISEQHGGDEVYHVVPQGSSSKRLQGRCAISSVFVEECSKQRKLLPWRSFTIGAAAKDTAPSRPPLVQAAGHLQAQPHAPGRLHFTVEEDQAMANWVAANPGMREQGRKLWEKAERAGVTRHPWQSMQNRWRRRVQDRQRKEALAQRQLQLGPPRARKEKAASPTRPRQEEDDAIEPVEDGEAEQAPKKRARRPRSPGLVLNKPSPTQDIKKALFASGGVQDIPLGFGVSSGSRSPAAAAGKKPVSQIGWPNIPQWLLVAQDLGVQIECSEL